MTNHTLLHSELLATLSRLGHTQSIVIADCGLPISAGVKTIDVAIKAGVPSFLQLLDVILEEARFERVLLAEEIRPNKALNAAIMKLLRDHNPAITIDYMSHELFKEEAKRSEAVVRTGEQTPFANIILYSASF